MDEKEKIQEQEADIKCKNKQEPQRQYRKAVVILALGWLVIFSAVTMLDKDSGGNNKQETEVSGSKAEKGQKEDSSVKMIIVTGKEEAESVVSAERVSAGEKEADRSTEEYETRDWEEFFFGPSASGIYTSQIQISGLSSKEMELINFSESAFTKSASEFLERQGIKTRRIDFEKRIDCSSENAVAYLATIDGYEDEQLTVIFYPECAGKFLYTLEHVEEETAEINAVAQTEAAVPQTETSKPQAAVSPQPQVQMIQTERTYDATRLSVYSIPKELLNYIDNRYMLQYQLYDYLYKNGYEDVTSATVTDYKINGDTRTAKIFFVLDNGKKVTGLYEKAEGSYRFS